MARVVMIHGAFNELWGPYELKARWMPALRDGLWHHSVEIDDTDVGVCFWGDLFRPQPNSESELQRQRSHLGADDPLRSLPGHNVIAALGMAANEAAHERTIEMLRMIVATPDVRARMRARAEAVITDNTRVIVAHSIGTLLAHTALCNNPHWRVHTLVTLGSPLALPSIFQFLDPPPINDMGHWPGSIERWVNIRAIGDKAAEVTLQEKFGPRVEERFVYNGYRAHDPEPYLNAAATGAAIAAGLVE